jgi:hypothetical protein
VLVCTDERKKNIVDDGRYGVVIDVSSGNENLIPQQAKGKIGNAFGNIDRQLPALALSAEQDGHNRSSVGENLVAQRCETCRVPFRKNSHRCNQRSHTDFTIERFMKKRDDIASQRTGIGERWIVRGELTA